MRRCRVALVLMAIALVMAWILVLNFWLCPVQEGGDEYRAPQETIEQYGTKQWI